MQVTLTAKERAKLLSWNQIKEIAEYKDLLFTLVRRDINVVYKQSVLGFGWAIIRPVTQMIIFTVVFGKLAGLEKQMDGGMPYAIFAFVALVPWTYFSAAFSASTASLISDKTFLTKVYFPRLIIPLTPLIAKLVDFVIAFSFLIIMLLFYGIFPSWHILYLPLLIILVILTSFGLSLWFSAMAIQYRDINQLTQFINQLMLYAAPIMWPVSLIPDQYLDVVSIYPMVGIIEGFRVSMTGLGEFPWRMIMIGSITTFFILITGLMYFRSKERIFADVA